jgi:zinc transport system substrate-binding protein
MRRPAACFTLCLALALAGCGAGGSASSGASVDVVAAVYPLAFVAEAVGGPDVTVRTITKPGAEPHDVELTPNQVGDLEDADVVVYVAGLQPAVDDAVPSKTGFDVTEVVELAAGEAHAEGEGEDSEHEGGDPHVWLDPVVLADVADALAGRLGELDEDRRKDYESRAAVLRRSLTRLDEEYETGLADCERSELVVSHAAFGYLGRRYGLEQIPIAGLDAEADPSPAQVAAAAAKAKAAGATTVFFEALVSPRVAQTVAREIGATTAVLDPIEGAPAKGDYLDAMRANLAALRTGLGCR